VYWEDDQWRSRYTPLFSYDRTKILHHITDQDFLKRVVHRFRGADSRSDNEGSDALRNITDQQYLIELAQNESVNCFLREAALQGVNDITVLQNFANPVIQPSGYYTTAENGTPIFHLTKSSKDQERDRKLYNLSLAAQKRLEKLST